MADSRPGGKKYWETSPQEVKLFCYAITDAALEAMRDSLRLKEMDGNASLEELSELDGISEAIDGEEKV